MKLTAVTCTTPERWARVGDICTRYLKRQTQQPHQWLVLDGPEPMPAKVLSAIEGGRIEGDGIVFFEDDDWFRSDWLEWCAGGLQRYEVVGEGHAVYYQVRRRWWSECRNVRHAALVQTAVHRDAMENLANVIRSYQSPFFDTRIWQLEADKFLAIPKADAERRVVGIKGLFDDGYSGEHRALLPNESRADPSMLHLFRWVGDDAEAYLPFYERPS